MPRGLGANIHLSSATAKVSYSPFLACYDPVPVSNNLSLIRYDFVSIGRVGKT
jgi:hypothetical protein